MENYPPNSQASRVPAQEPAKIEKTDEKKIEAVVTGGVSRRKKPLGKRFSETFFGDSLKNVGKYVLDNVLVPALKDTFADVVSQGIERMVYGESKSSSRRTGFRPGGFSHGNVSYNRSYQTQSPRRDEPRPMTRRPAGGFDFDEIVLPTRAEAEMVIDRMFDIINKYEQVSVSDLYRLVDISPPFTYEKWGWSDLRGANIARVRNGYLLDLPRPEPIE